VAAKGQDCRLRGLRPSEGQQQITEYIRVFDEGHFSLLREVEIQQAVLDEFLRTQCQLINKLK